MWTPILSQGIEFLQISHHEIFPSVGGLGSRFVSNKDHFSALRLEFMSPLFQNVHPG